jgi:hypothetical protein
VWNWDSLSLQINRSFLSTVSNIFSNDDISSTGYYVWFLKETQLKTFQGIKFFNSLWFELLFKISKNMRLLKEFEELWNHFIFISESFLRKSSKSWRIYTKIDFSDLKFIILKFEAIFIIILINRSWIEWEIRKRNQKEKSEREL